MLARQEIRREAMRIGGREVSTPEAIEVRYPYTNEVIGTVPAGKAEHAAEAFRIARDYKPKLTRYERQQILFRTAALIAERRQEIATLIRLELGISQKHAIYETTRSYDVFMLAGQLAILDDGQIFSCDLTPNGKQRKIFTKREPVRAISTITPFNHPLNMVAHKIAPAVATNNCVVCKPTELTPLTAILLADLLYEAGLVEEAQGEPRINFGRPMFADHRRILATGIARLRAKIKYRPVVFELMADAFTLLQLQRAVEALAGLTLHKQNFRRLIEQQQLVEETGEIATETGGRPAKLFRFRQTVLDERALSGTKLPLSRN